MQVKSIWEALQATSEPIARQALILALASYQSDQQRRIDGGELIAYLNNQASSSSRSTVRSAAVTVLKSWGLAVPQPDSQFNDMPKNAVARDWWQNDEGVSMVLLTLPVFDDGPQALVVGRKAESSAGPPVGTHRFAISASEISREMFMRKEPDFNFLLGSEDDVTWPANNVYAVVAMRYCRWLSDLEKIPEEEMCYPPIDQIDRSHLRLSDEDLKKSSYRLPTEAEWEYACAAGTSTRWSHGWDRSALVNFSCYAANSGSKLFPIGSLYPNAWGLFDFHGNVGEWCHPAPSADGVYALRGGNYTVTVEKLTTQQLNYPGSKGYSFTGFRVARTLPGETEGTSE